MPMIADTRISKKVLSPPILAAIDDETITSINKYIKKYIN